MYVEKVDRLRLRKVREKGAKNVMIQLLIDRRKARSFIMRRFIVERGGETPLHTHEWEHEVYVLRGQGIVTDGKLKRKLSANTVVYIPPNEKHQFKNVGRSQLIFLCLIPKI